MLPEGLLELVPVLPTVYRFPDTIPGEKWTYWGWCSLSDLSDLICKSYHLDWGKVELLERFRVPFDDRNRSMFKLKLRVMERTGVQKNEFSVVICDGPVIGQYKLRLKTIEEENLDLFVPTGWAKDVLWTLSCGGRGLRPIRFDGRQRTELWAVDERGELVMAFS